MQPRIVHPYIERPSERHLRSDGRLSVLVFPISLSRDQELATRALDAMAVPERITRLDVGAGDVVRIASSAGAPAHSSVSARVMPADRPAGAAGVGNSERVHLQSCQVKLQLPHEILLALRPGNDGTFHEALWRCQTPRASRRETVPIPPTRLLVASNDVSGWESSSVPTRASPADFAVYAALFGRRVFQQGTPVCVAPRNKSGIWRIFVTVGWGRYAHRDVVAPGGRGFKSLAHPF